MSHAEAANMAASPASREPSPTRQPRPASPTFSVCVQEPSHTATPARLDTQNEKVDYTHLAPDQATLSPMADDRETAHRLVDDLELLRIERLVSQKENQSHLSRRSGSRTRARTMREPEDTFNTTGVHPTIHAAHKSTVLTRLWTRINRFPRVFRYIAYLTPVSLLLLIPILLDIYAYDYQSKPVGGANGVQLLWFGIWLQVVWLTLWAARLVTAVMPFILELGAKLIGSVNYMKWKGIGRQIELHMALFLWMLAVIASFLPIVETHRVGIDPETKEKPYIKWIDIVQKVIVGLFVLATLNFVEKILIQWIATSFHMRTYSDRIAQNRLETDYCVRLYEYAKTLELTKECGWDEYGQSTVSGSRTPLQSFHQNARRTLNRVGDVANRMAGDFTGRKMLKGDHPRKVVTELLRSTSSSHTLARLFYRTFVRPDRDTITFEDLQPAFTSVEDAEACFGVFDKDLNGDITMDELELVCNEIQLEKKAIAASLKDFDSVIQKLDKVFVFVIFVIAVVVFISIISNSAAAALTSAGTVVLGLAWVLQATAQEFLQSIIFVFVKHPFDVGDRVTVYGNTGSMMKGDDYYVQEISLLYTEFKKMEGHTVQAPNSLLNTLFILNQRRSTGLADPVELKLRFGTSIHLIDELKARMLQFVLDHKRDYAPKILTEVRTIDELYSITMNFIFFHKSSYQNELVRLQRHDKFAVELMRQIHELGIQGPRYQQPGGTQEWPLFLSSMPPQFESREQQPERPPPTKPLRVGNPLMPSHSVRQRADSRGASGRAFAAAMAAESDPHEFGDVYESRRQNEGVGRVTSIRSPPPRTIQEGYAIGEEIDRQETGASGGAGSGESLRHRMWGRNRGASVGQQSGQGVPRRPSQLV
ncbi:Mechanosensitive ion channel-domain-containing protein [Coniochaeta sp. 2T2.1]|nr:Mechanosensitive ion channel-domain-containing protein [Coniochaeta sp. 2T2.1]